MATEYCQSCGMPMKADPKGGATLQDGSRTREYCSHCMENGAFLNPETDVRVFQAWVVDQMVEEGWWRPVAWIFTRGIPRLRRWKKAEA